jgi:hypothetical protein
MRGMGPQHDTALRADGHDSGRSPHPGMGPGCPGAAEMRSGMSVTESVGQHRILGLGLLLIIAAAIAPVPPPTGSTRTGRCRRLLERTRMGVGAVLAARPAPSTTPTLLDTRVDLDPREKAPPVWATSSPTSPAATPAEPRRPPASAHPRIGSPARPELGQFLPAPLDRPTPGPVAPAGAVLRPEAAWPARTPRRSTAGLSVGRGARRCTAVGSHRRHVRALLSGRVSSHPDPPPARTWPLPHRPAAPDRRTALPLPTCARPELNRCPGRPRLRQTSPRHHGWMSRHAERLHQRSARVRPRGIDGLTP